MVTVTRADSDHLLLTDTSTRAVGRSPVAETDIEYRIRLLSDGPSLFELNDCAREIAFARDLGTVFSELGAGTIDIVFDNFDGTLSPENPASPYGLRPNLKINVDAIDIPAGSSPFILDASKLDGTDALQELHPLFTGFIDEIEVRPGMEEPRQTIVRGSDRMKDVMRRRVTTNVLTNVNVGSAFATVFEAAGIPGALTNVDSIADELPQVWYRDAPALEALRELIEAGGYSMFVSASGAITVKDRFYEIGQTIVASFDFAWAMNYQSADTDITNVVRVTGQPRELQTAVGTLAVLGDVLSIPASGFVGFELDYLDPINREPTPALAFATPVSSQDFETNTNSDGSGSNTTNTTSVSVTFRSETAVNTVFNGSGTATFLTRFQLRGQAYSRLAPLSVFTQDNSSQSLFGERDFTLESRFIGNRTYAQQYAQELRDLHDDLTPKITFALRNEFSDMWEYELGEVIHIVNSHLGVDGQHTIVGMDHQIAASDEGWIHEASFRLERTRSVDVLVLDDPVKGLLDSGNRYGR